MDDDFNEYGNFDDPYGDLFQDLDENSLRIEEYTMESFYGGNGWDYLCSRNPHLEVNALKKNFFFLIIIAKNYINRGRNYMT